MNSLWTDSIDEYGPKLCSVDFGIGEIALAMTALSAAMSVAGGVAGANTQKQNAMNAKADANLALQQGESEATRQRSIVRAQQSELLAGTGAQGTVTTGSPMEVYLANAKQGEMEAQDKIYGGQLKARGLKSQAGIYNRQATGALIGAIGEGAGKLGSLASTLLQPKPKPGTTPEKP